MEDTTNPPIVEKIRQNVITTLATITVANGYFADFVVESVSRFGNSTADNTVVVEQGEERVLGEEDENAAVGQDSYVQDFLVWVNIAAPEMDVIDFDRRINLAVSDVRKAMLSDVTRGGFAYRTEKAKAELFTNAQDQVAGVMVPFKVHYRTRLDDPYHQ